MQEGEGRGEERRERLGGGSWELGARKLGGERGMRGRLPNLKSSNDELELEAGEKQKSESSIVPS